MPYNYTNSMPSTSYNMYDFGNTNYYQGQPYNDNAYRRPIPPRRPMRPIAGFGGIGGFALPFTLGFLASPLIFNRPNYPYPRPYPYYPYY